MKAFGPISKEIDWRTKLTEESNWLKNPIDWRIKFIDYRIKLTEESNVLTEESNWLKNQTNWRLTLNKEKNESSLSLKSIIQSPIGKQTKVELECSTLQHKLDENIQLLETEMEMTLSLIEQFNLLHRNKQKLNLIGQHYKMNWMRKLTYSKNRTRM